MSARRAWVDREEELSIRRQCELSGVNRAWVYQPLKCLLPDDEALLLMRMIDMAYTQRPFYGSRRMVTHLKTKGHQVNRKRVQRLMRHMGLAGMAPGPNTSQGHPAHKVYPYLLRGVDVVRPKSYN